MSIYQSMTQGRALGKPHCATIVLMETHYLEYSDPNGHEHKFYEVTLSDCTLTIRYGRIGTDGQLQSKTLSSPKEAASEAQKKIRAKTRKGYAYAVKGERKKRPITRRETSEVTPSQSVRRAPVLWRLNTGSPAFGIYANSERIWIGNQSGQVITVDPNGETLDKVQLPDGVKCLVSDGLFFYAGCDDGNVYDLSGKIPFVAYTIEENVDILWLDICQGILGASDAKGNVYAFNPEGEHQWGNVSQQGQYGWMVRMDDQTVFHGDSHGVSAYDTKSGIQLWTTPTKGAVLFGWQDDTHLYAATSHRKVERLNKKGQIEYTYACDSAVFSCASSPDGHVFAGDNASALYAFSASGERLWKFNSGCGSALSMQYLDGRLFIVTSTGVLAALDVSPTAIAAAQTGELPHVKDLKISMQEAVRPIENTHLESAAHSDNGIVLLCVNVDGKLRIRVESPGYNSTWNVQFPRNLRTEGQRYLVDGLVETHGFYRIVGTIRRLM